MSELLDRIQREIRERLKASRAAVLEQERLEAALHALGDAGVRATRAVTGRGGSSRAPEAPRRSRAAVKPSGSRPRSSERSSAASGGEKRDASARRGSGASASARQSGAAVGGRRERARPGAGGPARSTRVKAGRAAAGAAATPARKRAARGANRDAVLRVIGERPGVTARELAATSQVTGGTLYSLLRRLTDKGMLEKRELPGGQAGYALAARTPGAEEAAASLPETATTKASAATEWIAATESSAAAAAEQDRPDSTRTADAARSAQAEAQENENPPKMKTDAEETPTEPAAR